LLFSSEYGKARSERGPAIEENSGIRRNASIRKWKHNTTQSDLAGEALPMRDLVLATSPLAAVLYFLVNQDQFGELLAWVEAFVH
jgi:hypothetical protein